MLSRVYGRATELRRAWYGRRPHRVRRLDRPVVSVGNVLVGGSGKTPLVAAIVRLLAAAGERPAILSRGYGRREPADGVVVVSDGRQVLATPGQAGDEPYMLARTLPGVPVFVSPDRYLAGRLAEWRFGCTVHVLDDGFQHVQLARDVDLVVMSRADLDERLLPLGRLREPLAAARAAHALLVAGGDEDVQAVAAAVGVKTTFRVARRYGAPRPIASSGAVRAGVSAAASAEAGRRVVAVAGIARPERFFAALRELGWDVARECVFRDHHWFTPREVATIDRAAADTGADLVMTTEKDSVRLPEDVDVGRAPTARHEAPAWAYLPLEVVVEPADRFASWLQERLSAARREAA